MKPIAILQHEATQGPGVFEEYLSSQGIAYELITPCVEGCMPWHASDYRGVVVLGSNHCANEPLHWIEQECSLLQDALAHDIPVLGHCFGAQMLARAMGARVRRNPCPNIGWSNVWVTRQAQELLELPREIAQFNWHYDTFEIPSGAIRSLYGTFCLNKGFLHGRNWAFQGHLEVTAQSVQAWCDEGHEELCQAYGPAVQSEAQILSQLPLRIAALRATAVQVYGAWTRQLNRPMQVCLGGLPDVQPGVQSDSKLSVYAQLHAGQAVQFQASLAEKTKAILKNASRTPLARSANSKA